MGHQSRLASEGVASSMPFDANALWSHGSSAPCASQGGDLHPGATMVVPALGTPAPNATSGRRGTMPVHIPESRVIYAFDRAATHTSGRVVTNAIVLHEIEA